MNEHFSIQRLAWLLRADLVGSYRPILTISAVLTGIILIASLLSADLPDAAQAHFTSWYGVMLFIWGIVATSRAFPELHDKDRNQTYLLLPASAAEKTVARLLAVTLGLGVYLLMLTTAVSLLAAAVHSVLPGPGHGLFNPLDPQTWPLIASYLFLQSFFFLGAAWFRRRHFIKTTLAMMAAGIGLGIFAYLILRIVFAPVGLADMEGFVIRALGSYQDLLRVLEWIGTMVAFGLPVALWSIAWLRVRETQVSDGI